MLRRQVALQVPSRTHTSASGALLRACATVTCMHIHAHAPSACLNKSIVMMAKESKNNLFAFLPSQYSSRLQPRPANIHADKTSIHTYMHTNTCIRTHAYTHAYPHACIGTHVHSRTHICTRHTLVATSKSPFLITNVR